MAYFSEGARLPRGRENYYYGARYVVYPERSLGDPKISVWLSVDPLALDFPGWSPYNFTMNSPLNLVDPDGMAPGDPKKMTERRRALSGKPEFQGVIAEVNFLRGFGVAAQGRLMGASIGGAAGEKRDAAAFRYSDEYYDKNAFHGDDPVGYYHNRIRFSINYVLGYTFEQVEVVDEFTEKVVAEYTVKTFSYGFFKDKLVEGTDIEGNEYKEFYSGMDLGFTLQAYFGIEANLACYSRQIPGESRDVKLERIFEVDNTNVNLETLDLSKMLNTDMYD